MNTKLIYLEKMHDLEAQAVVERVEQQGGRAVVYLDQTILYPQGGGQPYDTGQIKGEHSSFVVEEVRFADGKVLHIGRFEGTPFIQGENVEMVVDAERRKLNARLHSAGHLVDMAVNAIGLDWVPAKGYHFPDSPYVEYDGALSTQTSEELVRQIQRLCDEFVSQDIPVSCRFVERGELDALCRHVPVNLPENKPIRIVQFDRFAVPCGGTHVGSLADLRKVTITKLKSKGGSIRVGYNVSH